jgi:transglutaminase-like putative cysteine protease
LAGQGRAGLGAAGFVAHPDLGVVRYQVDEVPEDPEGQVTEVIALMRRYAVEDAGSAEIQGDAAYVYAQAEAAARRAPSQRELADTAFWWVRRRIAFQRDEVTLAPFQTALSGAAVEALIRPVDMSRLISSGRRTVGDCDDFVMYLASVLLALNLCPHFVTAAADARDPARFSHVYVAAYLNDGQRVALDASHGPQPGWEVEPVFKREEWFVSRNCSWPAVAALAAAVVFGLIWRLQ